VSQHAKLSASAAHRWMVCPGSVRESAGMPNKSNEAAATGSVAHDIASTCLTEGGVNPEKFLDDVIEYEGFKIQVTQEMVDAIWVYLKYVDDRRSDEKGMLWVEVDLTPALQGLHPSLGGTADAALYQPGLKCLHVIDYKHGSGVFVGVAGNKQLLTYALGALLTFDTATPDIVVSTVVQPRCGSDDNLVRTETFDAIDLLDFAADLVASAEATEQGDAPLVISEAGCRFCPARVKCPELEKQSAALIEMDFDKHLATIMSPDEMGATLLVLPALEARIKALRQEAYDMATRGTPPTGHKLVAKRGRRAWTDAEAAEKVIDGQADCYKPKELKSLAQVEKALGKKVFAKKLGGLTAMVSSGYTLAADSDPRPPALEAGEGDFDTGDMFS